MIRSFAYKVKLSPSAERKAENQLRLCCELHNAAIEERREAWKQRISIAWYDQNKQLTLVKRDRPEFREIGSGVTENVLRRVDLAFKGFFRRVKSGQTPGYPRFRSFRRYDSLTFRAGSGWKLDDKRLTLQGIGTAKLFLSRPVEGRIRTVTLRRDRCGDWFVSFTCDRVEPKPLPTTGLSVGLDVGLNAFVASSDGEFVYAPKPYRAAQIELGRTQRAVSKQKKGGANRRKRLRTLARKHRRVERIRKDFHHKTALSFIRRYDVIAVEDLNVAGLKRSRFGKPISDAGWSSFTTMLRDKAEKAGRVVIAVNPRGTSQVCSNCGCVPEIKKTLSDRTHICLPCGYTADRDTNAAVNILTLATGEARLVASRPANKAAA